MILYADASVVAALALGEPSAAHIEARSDAADDVVISDFGIGEAVSAVSIALRRERLTLDQAQAIVDRLRAGLPGWTLISCDGADLGRAIDLVMRFDLRLRMPDAIHIAIAERLDATLFSGDERQVIAARTLGVPVERLNA